MMALQNGLIDGPDLVSAFQAWGRAGGRPLAEILVERGALEPSDRDALGPMVDRHVARHGGDPAASLAALTATVGIALDLRRAAAADKDTLSHLGGDGTDPLATVTVRPPTPAPPVVRYRKVRDHARGGLGVVFVARDEELNREVAIKEIRGRRADEPESQARFLLEAEITGGLEHPGIVPVYGLGRYDDGRPYYAMRLIRGESLKRAIAAFHAATAPKDDPGARALGLQKLLRRFLDVCDAVAYAHSRGVLHRDLKPENVMVGRFGETLVVDWGLAKAVGRPGDDGRGQTPGSTPTLRPSGGPAGTRVGSVIGTPGYRSPEQAAGRGDLLGPASDVYSLGATLYTLLTARVPFAGKDPVAALRRARAGEFPRPREAAPWLDPALEAVCLKAMSLRPADRYPSPRALADDLERWRADEPVAAHREPFARRARRWARRHRTAVTTTAATAAVAAALLGLLAWSALDRRRHADAAGLATLAPAEQQLGGISRATGDPARWAEAVAEARRAEAQLDSGGGSAAVRARARAALAALQAGQAERQAAILAEGRDRRMVADLEEARLRRANIKHGHFDDEAMTRAIDAAFRSHGIDVTSLAPEEAAARVRSSRIAGDLIAALEEWATSHRPEPHGARLEAILRAAVSDPGHMAIRDSIARRDWAGLRRLIQGQGARRGLGPGLRTAFAALCRSDPAGSLPLLEAIRRENPGEFWINLDLGMAYRNARPPRPAEAVRCLTAAVAVRPDTPGAHVALGNALRTRDDDAAVAEFREAIRLRPDYAQAHGNLGLALRARGDIDGTVAEFREAARLEPDLAEARIGLGNALSDKGDDDAALAEFREAARLRPDLAWAHNSLGHALRRQGHLDEALRSFERGHEIGSRQAGGRDPSAKWAQECRRLVELEAKLPAILKGEAHPGDADERLALAGLCHVKKLQAASARFYGEAFAERPAPAEDPATGHRHHAARAASLAGSGIGRDDPAPDESARAGLRGRARDWLRADLTAWAGRLDGGKPEDLELVARTLARWKADPDLAGVRGEEALAGLPEAEREAWRSLWKDAEALRLRAVGGEK